MTTRYRVPRLSQDVFETCGWAGYRCAGIRRAGRRFLDDTESTGCPASQGEFALRFSPTSAGWLSGRAAAGFFDNGGERAAGARREYR
jgi:hypothetical protein